MKKFLFFLNTLLMGYTALFAVFGLLSLLQEGMNHFRKFNPEN